MASAIYHDYPSDTLTSPLTIEGEGSSNAIVEAKVTGTGDPKLYLTVGTTPTARWVLGADNSVSGDPLKLSFDTGGAVETSTLLTFVSGAAGATVKTTMAHTDTANAASHAVLAVQSGGASGGDAAVAVGVAGVRQWVMGVDNSDSDTLKWSTNTTDTGSVDTTELMSLTTGGLWRVGGTAGVNLKFDPAAIEFGVHYQSESTARIALNINMMQPGGGAGIGFGGGGDKTVFCGAVDNNVFGVEITSSQTRAFTVSDPADGELSIKALRSVGGVETLVRLLFGADTTGPGGVGRAVYIAA